MQQLSGYRAGASLVHDVLRTLHPVESEGLSDVGRLGPEGERLVRVCPLSGGRATAACPGQTQEWQPVEPEPCPWHVLADVDVRTGGLATESTPPGARRTRGLADLPARYAAWAEREGVETLPRAWVDDTPQVEVLSPRDGDHLLRDPEAPDGAGTVLLAAAVDPPGSQVVWYVDGEPWKVVDAPYTARWPLEPGEHVLEARLPFDARGAKVRITAR
ncbi:MAG: hypothetical protein EP330_13045 [Deltaproteobacteria bacterium]|nr:MAG: hypothetical protein EP330_13045 [Deltaproteobacteria bacterium]